MTVTPHCAQWVQVCPNTFAWPAATRSKHSEDARSPSASLAHCGGYDGVGRASLLLIDRDIDRAAGFPLKTRGNNIARTR
jgi:hypothetical protein